MTVEELREALKAYPPTARVLMWDDGVLLDPDPHVGAGEDLRYYSVGCGTEPLKDELMVLL